MIKYIISAVLWTIILSFVVTSGIVITGVALMLCFTPQKREPIYFI